MYIQLKHNNINISTYVSDLLHMQQLKKYLYHYLPLMW